MIERIRLKKVGQRHTNKTIEKMKGRIPWNKGKSNPLWKGANNPAWKGGITSESEKIRKSTRYYEWRKRVFDRDDYTCQMCGERGGKLNADHELPFSKFPALRFELLNGRTLCVDCHKLTPTYGELAKTFDI